MKQFALKFFAIVTVLLLPASTYAAPLFFPGQTTNPGCTMGSANCTVFPMSIGGGVASGTPGSVPFIDNSGALQQDNQNLKWDQALHKLTLSQGLTLGHVTVADTVTVSSVPSAPVISGNYAYVTNQLANNLSVIDITNPASASVVATVPVGGNPLKPVISGNYLYIANLGGTVSVVDISNPATASVVATVTVEVGDVLPVVSGNYLYVSNNAFNGKVAVIDISNPATASVVRTVTVEHAPSIPVISGHYLYVSNRDSSTFSVIDITTPATASLLTTISTGSNTGPLAPVISGNYAYVADSFFNFISVIDITTPASANVVTTVTTNNFPSAPVISGNYLYVSNGGAGTVSVVNITTPPSASVVASITVGSNPVPPVIVGNYAYVSNTSDSTFSIIDITTPASATRIGTLILGATPQAPVIVGNYAYVSNIGGSTVSVLNITDPANAQIISTVPVGSHPAAPVIVGTYAYVTNTNAGTVSIIDISQVSNVLPPSSVVALSVDGTIQSTILGGSGTIALYADTNGNIVPSFSDQSLKQNIENVTDALAKVKALQGVYFNWKDTERFGDNRELGFIAQQVEPVVPEVVRTVGGYKTLNYQNLVALQNEAIKELDARLTVMEAINGVEDAAKSLADQFANFLATETDKVIGGTVTFTGKIFSKNAEIDNGVTVKDRTTGDLVCMTVSNGAIEVIPGACDAQPVVSAPTTPAPETTAADTSTTPSASDSDAPTNNSTEDQVPASTDTSAPSQVQTEDTNTDPTTPPPVSLLKFQKVFSVANFWRELMLS